VTIAVENWGQYITGVAPLRVSLTLINSADFGSELAVGSPGGFIANGQTIDGHAIFIPDSLYALETGNYASGLSTDLAITLVASATNLANFYINPDPSAGTAVPADKIDLLPVLTHEIGHGLGFLGLADRVAPASGSSPIPTGAEEGIYDSFIQDPTMNGTVVATIDGHNAEAAYGTAINAGSAVPVPLYSVGGSLDVENLYHVNGNLGSPLSTDLTSPFLPVGTFIPISNLDLAILQDTGVPVTAEVACYARGTLIETICGPVAVEDLTLQDRGCHGTRDGKAGRLDRASARRLPPPSSPWNECGRSESPRVRSRHMCRHATSFCPPITRSTSVTCLFQRIVYEMT
jgi:hypothetical protein